MHYIWTWRLIVIRHVAWLQEEKRNGIDCIARDQDDDRQEYLYLWRLDLSMEKNRKINLKKKKKKTCFFKKKIWNQLYRFTIPTWAGMWMYVAGDMQYLPQICNIAHRNFIIMILFSIFLLLNILTWAALRCDVHWISRIESALNKQLSCFSNILLSLFPGSFDFSTFMPASTLF